MDKSIKINHMQVMDCTRKGERSNIETCVRVYDIHSDQVSIQIRGKSSLVYGGIQRPLVADAQLSVAQVKELIQALQESLAPEMQISETLEAFD